MWHPGSNQEGRLMLLTSDNSLRIFNMDLETNIDPEHTWILSDHQDKSSKGFFGESAMSLKGSLGETAVSFAFAPSVGNDPEPHLWPLFILCGDGSVFCMVTSSLNQNNQKPKLMGPLSMHPESDDNYGTDACSILCLHPKISSPPILIIATNHGVLYHCIVLQKLENEDCQDNLSQMTDGDWSILTMPNSVDLALHVYESIELELNLVSSESPQVSVICILFEIYCKAPYTPYFSGAI